MIAFSALAQNDSTEVDIEPDYEFDMEEIADEEAPEENEVFEIYQVQKKAVFKGGDKAMYQFIADSLVYPVKALENGVSGRVTVQFVVDTDGSISDVRIRGRRLGSGCEEAAMDVVKKMSGQWTPAMQRDKPVRMRFILPIKFQL